MRVGECVAECAHHRECLPPLLQVQTCPVPFLRCRQLLALCLPPPQLHMAGPEHLHLHQAHRKQEGGNHRPEEAVIHQPKDPAHLPQLLPLRQ